MFSKWVLCVLWFFTLFGVRPELPNMVLQQKISHITFLFSIVCTASLTVCSINVKTWLMKFLRTMHIVNGLSQYCFGLITIWTFIIQSIIQRKSQQKFWEIFLHIEQHFVQRNQIVLKIYLVKIFEFYLFFIFLTIFEFVSYPKEFLSEVLFAYRILSIIIINQSFYCHFYMELLVFELKTVENEAKDMFESNKNERLYMLNKTASFKRKRFTRLREYYQLIFELNECVNINFGWSVTFFILYGFFSLLCVLNWNYRNTPNTPTAISMYLWIIHSVFTTSYTCGPTNTLKASVIIDRLFL